MGVVSIAYPDSSVTHGSTLFKAFFEMPTASMEMLTAIIIIMHSKTFTYVDVVPGTHA